MPHGEPDIVFHGGLAAGSGSVEPEVYRESMMPEREVSQAVSETMTRLVEACSGNPKRIAIAVARSGRMSLQDIADRLTIDKVSVMDNLVAIGRRNKPLSEYLRGIKISKHNTTVIRDVMRSSGILARYRRNSTRIKKDRGVIL